MKMVFLRGLAAIVLFLGFSVKANPLNDFLDFYVGGDAQIRKMKYKSGFGDQVLPKHSPQANIYGGVKLSEHFGMEIGYESTISRCRTSYFVNGQMLNGIVVPPTLDHVVLKSKSRIKGFHFDFVGFQNLGKHSPWKIFASIGICELKGTVERTTVAIGHPSISGRTRAFCKRYTALRFGTGIQYTLGNGWAFRGYGSIVRTGRMVIKLDDDYQRIALPVFKPKDSFIIGIGTLYNF